MTAASPNLAIERKLPTRADWQRFTATLERPYDPIWLLVDGYRVELMSIVVKRRLEVLVKVNGGYEEFLKKDCPERYRFMRPYQSYRWSAKFRRERIARIKKMQIGGKKLKEAALAETNEQVTLYWPTWATVAPLKKHLVSHNYNIEILTGRLEPCEN